MRVAGLEPARYRYRGILSPLCLPIPPHPHKPRRNFSTHATAENQDPYAPCTDVLKLYFNGTLVGEGGFEPPKLLAADLQSVPFGHSGIRPDIALISSDYNTTDFEKNQVFCEHLSPVYCPYTGCFRHRITGFCFLNTAISIRNHTNTPSPLNVVNNIIL